ncbi:MAG: DegT/DnrJ/EryC1/StrS family aminotransferase [Candidatus Omnitrophota bacterium]
MVKTKKHIPLARPYFDKEEETVISSVIRSKWVMQGPRVAEFEEKFANYIGSKYAVAVSSGTAALHLSLLAIGISETDEVIIPSFSFIATANAVIYCRATPVFIDIDLRTYNISPEKIENYITNAIKKGNKNIRAIMPVHQFGMPADMDRITAIAKKYNLPVIEDAACALGSKYKGRKTGSIGDIGCFSFHPRKIITTGEGGMITTNNKEVAEKIRLLRNHGMNKEDYPIVGYNYRMTDLQGAIGIVQMKKLKYILETRRTIAKRYDRLLEKIDWLERSYVPDYVTTNYQSYPIRIKKNNYKIRDYVIAKLKKRGIFCKYGAQAIHLEKCYKGRYKRPDALINTERAFHSTVLLPLYHELKEEEQGKVVENLRKFYLMADRV